MKLPATSSIRTKTSILLVALAVLTGCQTSVVATPAPSPSAAALSPVASSTSVPSPTVSPRLATPSVVLLSPTPSPVPASPTALIADADQVWRQVATNVGDGISPILRPTSMPSEFDKIRLVNAGPGVFEVEYQGQGKRLMVGAGAFNPPPVGTGGRQDQITIRGHAATLQVASTARPSEHVWLWWEEPGHWSAAPSGATQPKVFYLLSADGIDPERVRQIATALSPASAQAITIGGAA